MRSVTAFAFAAVAASIGQALEFPSSFPLHKRQEVEPGTPRYECHENCGGVIAIARQEGYCDLPAYESALDYCLGCANTFGIWVFYGNGVGAAARGCGDTAVPSPSQAEEPPAPPTSTTPPPSPPTTTPPTPPPTTIPPTGGPGPVTTDPASPTATGGDDTPTGTPETPAEPETPGEEPTAPTGTGVEGGYTPTTLTTGSAATSSPSSSAPIPFEGAAVAIAGSFATSFLAAVAAFFL